MKILLMVSALLLSAASLAATPWQRIQHPIAGQPTAIGGFANGCIVGAQALPLNSPNYQVMRQDQRRYYGHPDLILFIQRLATQAHNLQLGNVLIGDMGMAAGGRFSDLAGAPIDYACADLHLRHGIEATNGALHDAVLAVTAAA